MVENKACAFVKFAATGDVELALKRNNEQIHICRSTEEQMQLHRQGNKAQSLSFPISQTSSHRNSIKSESKSDENSLASNVLKVIGLPWKSDEQFVIDLFPGNLLCYFWQFSLMDYFMILLFFIF